MKKLTAQLGMESEQSIDYDSIILYDLPIVRMVRVYASGINWIAFN